MSHRQGTRRDPAMRSDRDPLSAAVAQRDRDVMSMVQRAVARREVMLAFQPVMGTVRSGRPAFYEGLIRVLDETGRIIPAREFIEVVETSELGRRIDCLALEMGLESLAECASLRLSVNMSARSIGYPKWLATLRHGLRSDSTIAERLILEITESSAMIMPDVVTAFMRERQREGISFALDDFGAGQTSFRYLRDFYFDFLKIDGQFVRGIHANADNQCLVGALTAIGKHFDMITVAESVETVQDAAFLAELGVDCMQGYYFGAPTVVPPWRDPQDQRDHQRRRA
jgi:EAL domain-containing protein (putative c-di-GMP-specific phosphodiesterase class I)